MPFCPQCGTKNEEGARFCLECGASLGPSPPAPSVGQRSKLLPLGGIIIAAIIMIAAIALFLPEEELPPVTTERRGNTVGNIVNGGLVAKEGEWIYYSSNDGFRLYKIRTDGSGRTRLNDDFSYWLNVVDGWIYYTNWDDGDRIYKIRTDGSERTRLNDDISHYINVVDGWIYYSNDDENKLYKIRTDGSERQLVD